MLGHWETIWVCVAFTLLIIGLDILLAFRLKNKSQDVEKERKNRQGSMDYKQLEELR